MKKLTFSIIFILGSFIFLLGFPSKAQACQGYDGACYNWAGGECCSPYVCNAVGSGGGTCVYPSPTPVPPTSTPTPTPTPTPIPVPPPVPSILLTYGSYYTCTSYPNLGDLYTISWASTWPEVTYVDIITGSGDTYHKDVTGTLSTPAPSGFNGFGGTSGALVLTPNTTYQTRTWNGSQNSATTSFTTLPMCGLGFSFTPTCTNAGNVSLYWNSAYWATFYRVKISSASYDPGCPPTRAGDICQDFSLPIGDVSHPAIISGLTPGKSYFAYVFACHPTYGCSTSTGGGTDFTCAPLPTSTPLPTPSPTPTPTPPPAPTITPTTAWNVPSWANTSTKYSNDDFIISWPAGTPNLTSATIFYTSCGDDGCTTYTYSKAIPAGASSITGPAGFTPALILGTQNIGFYVKLCNAGGCGPETALGAPIECSRSADVSVCKNVDQATNSTYSKKELTFYWTNNAFPVKSILITLGGGISGEKIVGSGITSIFAPDNTTSYPVTLYAGSQLVGSPPTYLDYTARACPATGLSGSQVSKYCTNGTYFCLSDGVKTCFTNTPLCPTPTPTPTPTPIITPQCLAPGVTTSGKNIRIEDPLSLLSAIDSDKKAAAKYSTAGKCIIGQRADVPEIPNFQTIKSLYFDQAKSTDQISKNAPISDTVQKNPALPLNFSTAANDQLYNVTGDFTFPAGHPESNPTMNKSGVVFINGDLNIETDLTNPRVDTGLVFVVGGDVRIADTVTEVDAMIVTWGEFCSAWKDNACTPNTTASQLNIKGSVISLDGTDDDNNNAIPYPLDSADDPAQPPKFVRKLASSNSTTPAEQITYQPKYLGLFKNVFARDLNVWSEVE